MKNKFQSLLLSILFYFPLQAKVVYESLDPTSIPEHLAYYEVYNYPPALQHAWKLLSGKEGSDLPLSFPQNSNTFIALINPQETKQDFKVSDDALLHIEEIAKSLPNRKIKGHNVKSIEELFELSPNDIDLTRGLLLTQLDDPKELRRFEAMIDLMALVVRARCKQGENELELIRALNNLIFFEQGFRFPPHSTYSQQIDRFTFLPHVLESRRGVCLGVSTLYLCLAERLGLDVSIITPPGHIFVRCAGVNIETTLRGVHIHDDEYLGINLIALPERTKKEVIGMAFFNQASIYLSKGDFEKAASCYKKALPFMPNDKMAKTLYAASLFLTDHKTDALRYAKEALAIKEPFLISQYTLDEDIYYGRVDKEALSSLFLYVDETRDSLIKKKDALTAAISRCPNFRSGIFSLAITWLQLDCPVEAIKLLEKLPEGDISVHYYLSELYYSRYNAPKAWASYQKAEQIAKKAGHMPEALIQLKTKLSLRSS